MIDIIFDVVEQQPCKIKQPKTQGNIEQIICVPQEKKNTNSSLRILKRSSNHEKKPTKSNEDFRDAKCNLYQS